MTQEEKAKEAKRIYMQHYRKENRERLNAKRREWYENNKEYARKYHSIYNKRNREQIQEKQSANWAKKYDKLEGENK